MNNKQKKTRGNSNKEVDSTIQVMRKMDSSLQSVSTRPRKPSTSASGSTDAGPSSSSSSNIVSRSNSNQKLQDQEPKTPPPSRRLNFDSDDGDEKPISDHDLNYRDDQRLFRMTPHPTDKTSSMSWDEHSLRLPPPNNSQMRPPSKFLLTAVDGPPSDDDEADYQKSIMDMEMLPLTMPGGRRPFLSDSRENFAPPYNAPSLPRTARVPSATSSNNSNLGDADDESSSNSDVPEQRKKRAATLTLRSSTGTGQQQVMEVIGQLEKVLIDGNIVWRADA